MSNRIKMIRYNSSMQIVNIAAYRFVPVADPARLRAAEELGYTQGYKWGVNNDTDNCALMMSAWCHKPTEPAELDAWKVSCNKGFIAGQKTFKESQAAKTRQILTEG
jgi:hypothetical protein